MRNKKGQFYIVAAIIIVLAISGIASVKTYANVRAEPRNIKDLSSELKEESTRIVDYGIYKRENLTRILNNFTDSEFAPYFLKKTQDTDIIFIYGDAINLYSVQYLKNQTGTIYASLGGASPTWVPVNNYAQRTSVNHSGIGSTVTINVLDKDFEFEIRDNEMFYFLITQEDDGEVYIERN